MTLKNLSIKKFMPSTSYIAVVSVLVGLLVLYLYMHYVENFSDDTNNKDSHKQIVLMLFYADWCGHCKTFKPIWETAKTSMKKNNKNVDVKFLSFNADVDEDKKKIKKYNVSGFPTIKAKYNGKIHEFKGERTLEGLKEFVDSL